jgi:hypothetical protein
MADGRNVLYRRLGLVVLATLEVPGPLHGYRTGSVARLFRIQEDAS